MNTQESHWLVWQSDEGACGRDIKLQELPQQVASAKDIISEKHQVCEEVPGFCAICTPKLLGKKSPCFEPGTLSGAISTALGLPCCFLLLGKLQRDPDAVKIEQREAYGQAQGLGHKSKADDASTIFLFLLPPIEPGYAMLMHALKIEHNLGSISLWARRRPLQTSVGVMQSINEHCISLYKKQNLEMAD